MSVFGIDSEIGSSPQLSPFPWDEHDGFLLE